MTAFIVLCNVFMIGSLALIFAMIYVLKNHYYHLKRESSNGFAIVANPYFKGYPLPKSLLFINVDGDYEYSLKIYNFQSMFKYPHFNWCVGYQTTLKPVENDFLKEYEEYSLSKKLSYIYHTYYKVIFFEKFFELRSKGKTAEWKIKLMASVLRVEKF